MKITDLGAQPGVVRRQAAELLVEGFDHPRGWSSLEAATREVEHVLRQGFAFTALEDALLLGWIGGLPEYDGHVWELHPVVVRRDRRLGGIWTVAGRRIRKRGAAPRRTDFHTGHRRR